MMGWVFVQYSIVFWLLNCCHCRCQRRFITASPFLSVRQEVELQVKSEGLREYRPGLELDYDVIWIKQFVCRRDFSCLFTFSWPYVRPFCFKSFYLIEVLWYIMHWVVLLGCLSKYFFARDTLMMYIKMWYFFMWRCVKYEGKLMKFEVLRSIIRIPNVNSRKLPETPGNSRRHWNEQNRSISINIDQGGEMKFARVPLSPHSGIYWNFFRPGDVAPIGPLSHPSLAGHSRFRPSSPLLDGFFQERFCGCEKDPHSMHAANPFDLSEFIAAGGTAVKHWSVLWLWAEWHKNAARQNKQQSAILESGPSTNNQQQAVKDVMQCQVKAMATEDDATNTEKQAAT